jgi:membrane carboxypeptidase/penicillin-binding protein
MNQALRNTSAETLKPPSGIKFIRVNIETGLPSDGDSSGTILEAFIDGSLPRAEKEDHEKETSSAETPLRGKSPRDLPASSGR